MISCADEYGATPGTIGHLWVSPPPGVDLPRYDSKNWVGNFSYESDLLQGMITHRGLSSAIYTQISDVEAEVNGIQSYDRILKLSPRDVDQVRALNYRLWQRNKNDDEVSNVSLPLLASLFTDYCVLQRAPATPKVWGWSMGGAQVLVQVSGMAPLSTKAADDGSWSVTLPATPATSNATLEVRSGNQHVTRKNVAFGEVSSMLEMHRLTNLDDLY